MRNYVEVKITQKQNNTTKKRKKLMNEWKRVTNKAGYIVRGKTESMEWNKKKISMDSKTNES